MNELFKFESRTTISNIQIKISLIERRKYEFKETTQDRITLFIAIKCKRGDCTNYQARKRNMQSLRTIIIIYCFCR